MIAEYRSKCPVCGDWIEEGDEISHLDDDDAWVHAECAEEGG